MKICFSTLGCPEWSWEDMLTAAKDLGFDGIEVRGIQKDMYAPHMKLFGVEQWESVKKRIQHLNLEISCLTSSCFLFDQEKAEETVKEGREYIDLASRLGVPYVRVLGDKDPAPGADIDLSFVADKLAGLAAYAKDRGVMLLIETNGVLASSSVMLELLQRVNSEAVGVLWDIHHPYRYMEEKVEDTYRRLKPYIRHVHIKDSVIQDGKVTYKMTGHGDVPVREAVTLLKEDGFQGYVSLEWVKRWCMDLEEPGVVFSHFIHYIKSI